LTTDETGMYMIEVPAGPTVTDIDESTLPPGYEQTAGTNPTTVDVPLGGTGTDIDGYYFPTAAPTPNPTPAPVPPLVPENPPTSAPSCIPRFAECSAAEECCEELECGITGITTNPTNNDVLAQLGDLDQCCVPMFDLTTGEPSPGAPQCKSGYKPLNIVLTSDRVLDQWNGCCDADAYCDPNGNCVPCLPTGGIGCTSTDLPGFACCGIDSQCSLNADPPPPRLEQSNRCCIKNNGMGCATDPLDAEANHLNCCQEGFGFQCIADKCCVPPQSLGCMSNSELCCGGTTRQRCIQKGTGIGVGSGRCCVRDQQDCDADSDCCNENATCTNRICTGGIEFTE